MLTSFQASHLLLRSSIGTISLFFAHTPASFHINCYTHSAAHNCLDMACKKCSKTVSDAEGITCRGFCGEKLHVICAQVDIELLEQLRTNEKNVFWMCNDCAELFSNGHFRNIVKCGSDQCSTTPTSIESMKADIEKLNSAVTALATKLDPKTSTSPFPSWPRPRFDRSNPLTRTPKRQRTSIDVEAKPVCRGTKPSIGSVKTVGMNEDLLWIYLSAFHPSTSDDDIASLVTECLSLEPNEAPKVVKLLPRGRDPSTLSYISFKVGVIKNKRDSALSCDSWPEGVQFREFDDSRSIKVTSITRPTPME